MYTTFQERYQQASMVFVSKGENRDAVELFLDQEGVGRPDIDKTVRRRLHRPAGR